jgi:pimeloyl-ACP methyl ester carboxylesterase
VIRRIIVGFAAAAAALSAAPAAGAAPPLPFGHACVPQDGVLFCPSASDADRVPSWDGVPLDVDVTLPPSGDGPFPTIVMMHGWGGNKGSFETHSPDGSYNNVYFASRGYAVVTYTARGWGRSCGAADSRTSPGCDRGWIHLGDHRYEARDTQHLLGLLVDQGVTSAATIGVTGVSYGGIQTLNLARLRDRVRMEDGSFVPWTSPNGTPLAIKAGYARWPGSDMTYALQPNGRFTDFRTPRLRDSIRPGGVEKTSYNDILYVAGQFGGFYAPPGGPFNSDITRWKALADRGEPARPDVLAVGRELTDFHSWMGLTGPSAALIVQNGWTDDLFPAPEALRVYRTFTAAPRARLSLQLGNFGHPRGGNNLLDSNVMLAEASSFFDFYLKGQGQAPDHGSVLAFTQTCPDTGVKRNRSFRAENWERLHPKTVTMRHRGLLRMSSRGGNAKTAAAVDPIGGGGACATVRAEHARGTASIERRLSRPFTMLGMPTVESRIVTKGRGGFIAARLWDVHRGKQLLVSRGVYRLRDNQRGRIVFQLFGNGWAFKRGHVAKLELLGRDPKFLRTSNFRFSVRFKQTRVQLPGR